VIFEEFATEGCRSYLIGCDEDRVAAIVDPILDRAERYAATAAARGLAIQYLIDTHTHADHFSATRQLARELGAPVVMHRASPAPFVDLAVQDGDSLTLGTLRLRVLHTPGHTADSMCIVLPDRVLTGDTLLLGSLGRTDLPTGDAAALWDSLHEQIFALDPGLLVCPGHNYKSAPPTTLAEQRKTNPRLAVPDCAAFVAEMSARNLELPRHVTEALRTNASGGKPVSQLIRDAARAIAFMSIPELRRRVERGAGGLAIVDVREADAYAVGHVPGAIHIPRGQLELLVDRHFPDPATRVLTYCEFGKISTLAAATLRQMGFASAVALDGGFRDWVESGAPVAAAAQIPAT
jgi:glyoxylase-like metal-dependent hydrolase (beta-lactamase superfamily II)/rhodanese-related sulfurtransferase